MAGLIVRLKLLLNSEAWPRVRNRCLCDHAPMSKEAGQDPFVTESQREAAKHRQVTSQPAELDIVQGHDDSPSPASGAKGAGGYAQVKQAGHGRPAAAGTD